MKEKYKDWEGVKVKKILMFALVFLLAITPLSSTLASTELNRDDSLGSDEFIFDGVKYRVTFKDEGDTQVAVIESDDITETVSYNSKTNVLLINNEQVDSQTLDAMHEFADSMADIVELGEDPEFTTLAFGPKQPWSLHGTTEGKVNIRIATVTSIVGVVLLIPAKGTALVVGGIWAVKAVTTVVGAVVAATTSSSDTYIYYKLDTHYKNEQGYHKYKFTLSFYEDSKYKKRIDSIEKETRLGKAPK